jgi:3-dehydroquinate dehydratase I
MQVAPASYQILEIWLDYIEDLSEKGLETLIEARGQKELLLLFRRQQLAPPQLSYEQRLNFIKFLTALSLNDDLMLDFDVREQRAEIEWLKTHTHSTPLVLSYHNYQATPTNAELRLICNEMSLNKACIYKFSTYCQTRTDALRLLELLLELRSEEKRCTVLGMGADAIITRLFGPIWGSEIAYAPQVMANSSAPGQLTLEELQRLLGQLKVIHER